MQLRQQLVSHLFKKGQHGGPTLSGPLTPGQTVFGETLAKLTPLHPRVIGAWLLNEESGGAAQSRETQGNHNWLNVGFHDQGQTPITQSPIWSDPVRAAQETAAVLNGQRPGTGAGVAAIVPSSKGQGPGAQMQAIQSSGWASGGETALPSTYQQVSGSEGRPQINQNVVQKLRQHNFPVQKILARQTAAATGLGSPAPKVLSRFKAAVNVAQQIANAHIPYQLGGGHGATAGPTNGTLDCSGAVSLLLNKIGAMKGTLVSGDFGKVVKPGPGALTVFYNGGHVFMRIGKRYWGTSVGDSGAGGLGWHPAPSAAYLSQFSVGHVAGLDAKVAAQMGIPLTGGSGALPGMTLSPDGTTATINPGAGAVQGSPGFSQNPIIPITPLTPPVSAGPAFPQGYQQPASAGGPQQNTSQLLAGLLAGSTNTSLTVPRRRRGRQGA